MTKVLRLAAWTIAIAAVVDPGCERHVVPPAVVGINVAAASASPAIAEMVRTLSDRLTPAATVAREVARSSAPWCLGVDVCVVVTDGSATVSGRPDRPVHVVQVAAPPTTRLIAAQAPAGHMAAMNQVRVALAGGHGGDVVEIVVEDDGVEVGRHTHTRTVEAIDDDVVVPWWPRRGGARPLAVRLAEPAGESPVAVLASTSPVPLDVLVWEARPSWTGTFVRRALQDDPRLVVRTASQLAPRRLARRGVSGRPGDDDLRRARAVVVTGASSLDSTDIARLDRYARRGGAVVVALDDRPAGALGALLPGSLAGQRRAFDPVRLGALHAAELVTFTTGPGDTVLAAWDGAPDGQRGVVVERRSGRGVIVVSGALDAWRWRDDAGGFDRFWRDTVASAAQASSPALAAEWVPAPPRTWLRITSRDGMASGTWPALTLTRSCAGTSGSLQAIEAATPGTWLADPRGLAVGCTLTATSGAAQITTPWPGAATLPPSAPKPGELASLATVTGGSLLEGSSAAEAIAALVAAAPRRPAVPVSWHPMRAWWWFVPFVGLLGAEWWLRRRRGRA